MKSSRRAPRRLRRRPKPQELKERQRKPEATRIHGQNLKDSKRPGSTSSVQAAQGSPYKPPLRERFSPNGADANTPRRPEQTFHEANGQGPEGQRGIRPAYVKKKSPAGTSPRKRLFFSTNALTTLVPTIPGKTAAMIPPEAPLAAQNARLRRKRR